MIYPRSSIRNPSFWALLVAVLFAVTSLDIGDADARRNKRRKRGKRAQVTAKANVEALKELMGAFKFGMERDKVVQIVSKQIKERYAEQIAAITDVYRQDELRRRRDKEIDRLKESIVEFKGDKGGWDVSIVDDQFKHGTEESMLVHWETHQGRNQRRFFFFFNGKLYKMFIALDSKSLKEEQRNFAFFKSLMEARFGPGEVHDQGLRWEDRSFLLEALDKLNFYNSFCLVISNPKMNARVASLRKERAKPPKGRSAVIQAVTEGDDATEPSLDEGSNVMDDILGD